MKRLAILFLIGLFFAGCDALIDIDRPVMTELRLVKIESDYEYLIFMAKTSITCYLDEKAEARRIRWLGECLAEHGYPDAQYEIISRRPVFICKTLIVDSYEIYYDIRVKKAREEAVRKSGILSSILYDDGSSGGAEKRSTSPE